MKFIKLFKFLFPLLFLAKYGIFYYVMIIDQDAFKEFKDETNQEKMDTLFLYINAGIDGLSSLLIIIFGCVIEKKIEAGRKINLFPIPIKERNRYNSVSERF